MPLGIVVISRILSESLAGRILDPLVPRKKFLWPKSKFSWEGHSPAHARTVQEPTKNKSVSRYQPELFRDARPCQYASIQYLICKIDIWQHAQNDVFVIAKKHHFCQSLTESFEHFIAFIFVYKECKYAISSCLVHWCGCNK